MKKQAGFTLIELIVVIVILGILAATALPKFSDLTTDARFAAAQGALGSVNSAANIVHATALVRNQTGSTGTVILEGFNITTIFGYPDVSATGITLAANILTTSYQISTAGTSPQTIAPLGVAPINIVTTPTGTATGCNVVYTVAANANTPAVVGLAGLSGANCN